MTPGVPHNDMNERENTMYSQQILHMLAFQRSRDMERRIRRVPFDRPANRPGAFRRAIGRRFIQIGVAIAADGRLRQTG